MAKLDELIAQARKAAQSMGGLLSILLAIQEHSKITFDRNQAAFFIDGKKVTATEIRKELERLESSTAATVLTYNQRLYNDVWNVTQWREAMEKLAENSHILFGAIALGSIAAAVRASTVKRRIERDHKALKRFAAALRSRQMPTQQMANNRVRAYLRSFSVTYAVLDQQVHIQAGYTEAKRVVTAAEHCRNSLAPGGVIEGCLEAAHRSWMPIQEMPPIGTLTCKQFCKCFIIYR